jgi:hypothetical protein
MGCGLSSGMGHLGGAERAPEHESSDDLEDAHDDEPDPEQDGQGGE